MQWLARVILLLLIITIFVLFLKSFDGSMFHRAFSKMITENLECGHVNPLVTRRLTVKVDSLSLTPSICATSEMRNTQRTHSDRTTTPGAA
jgi:hypothetical protein